MGYAFSLWAMRVNPFFATVVRIQSERGHRLIDRGPYRWVRHPGYAGAVVAHPALPLSGLAVGLGAGRCWLSTGGHAQREGGAHQVARQIQGRGGIARAAPLDVSDSLRGCDRGDPRPTAQLADGL